MPKSKPTSRYHKIAFLLVLADPPGSDFAIVEAVSWSFPIIFLMVVTGMLLMLHLGLAPPAKRVLNGWLIILLPLFAVICSIICRPLLSSLFGKPFEGIWWIILLYPSLVVTYWVVFRWLFNRRVENASAEPLD